MVLVVLVINYHTYEKTFYNVQVKLLIHVILMQLTGFARRCLGTQLGLTKYSQTAIICYRL